MLAKTEQKLNDVTAQACSIIHEQLPENNFIVAIFDENEKTLGNTFRGEMSKQCLAVLLEATVDALAEATESTREAVLIAFLTRKSAISRKWDM